MNNKIIGNINFVNSHIEFKENNNVFFCNGNLTLENCLVRFTGSNSLIYIENNEYPMSLNMRVGNDSVIYIGSDCYINKTSNLYATERKNIIIGDQLLLSFDVYFRTADPHLIYDTKTKKRINNSKSILIGDRVWIGQSSLILKGNVIGSGCIIGGHSVLSNKSLKSNTMYAGSPAKKIRDNVFYGAHRSTHDFDEDQEKNSEYYSEIDIDRYVYLRDSNTISLKQIDTEISRIKKVSDKIEYIKENLSNNHNKNRFYNDGVESKST